jgi:hypothetical protein
MSLENLNVVPEFIEAAAEEIADTSNFEIPSIDIEESLFDDTERVSSLMHNLGSIPLAETVELQTELPDADGDVEALPDDTELDEREIEEDLEEEQEEEPEEEKPREKKKEEPRKQHSMYDGSESRSVALDMIYIATAIPADDIAA